MLCRCRHAAQFGAWQQYRDGSLVRPQLNPAHPIHFVSYGHLPQNIARLQGGDPAVIDRLTDLDEFRRMGGVYLMSFAARLVRWNLPVPADLLAFVSTDIQPYLTVLGPNERYQHLFYCDQLAHYTDSVKVAAFHEDLLVGQATSTQQAQPTDERLQDQLLAAEEDVTQLQDRLQQVKQELAEQQRTAKEELEARDQRIGERDQRVKELDTAEQQLRDKYRGRKQRAKDLEEDLRITKGKLDTLQDRLANLREQRRVHQRDALVAETVVERLSRRFGIENPLLEIARNRADKAAAAETAAAAAAVAQGGADEAAPGPSIHKRRRTSTQQASQPQ